MSNIQFCPLIGNIFSEGTKNGFLKQSADLLLVQERNYIQSLIKNHLFYYDIYMSHKLEILCNFFKVGNTQICENTETANYDKEMIDFNLCENSYMLNIENKHVEYFCFMMKKLIFINNIYPTYIKNDEIIIVCQPLSEFIKQENEYINLKKISNLGRSILYIKNKKKIMDAILLSQISKNVLNSYFINYYLNVLIPQEHALIIFLKQNHAKEYINYKKFKKEISTNTEIPNPKKLVSMVTDAQEPITEISESNVSESNVSQSNISVSQVSESNESESNKSESNVSESNVSQSNVSESNVSESNVSESNVCDQVSDLQLSPMKCILDFMHNFNILETAIGESLSEEYVAKKMDYVHLYNLELLKNENLKLQIELAKLK